MSSTLSAICKFLPRLLFQLKTPLIHVIIIIVSSHRQTVVNCVTDQDCRVLPPGGRSIMQTENAQKPV